MRWIRLDISFDDSPWLFVLSAESQLAWVKLLCHMKRDGSRGACKALSTIVAAKKWGVGEEAVAKMLQAAVTDGALTIESGHWALVNWDKYQETDNTATERKRRQRSRERDVTDVTRNEDVTDGHGVTSVTNRDRCRVTETETKTESSIPTDSLGVQGEAKTPRKAVGRFAPPTLEEAVAYFGELGSSPLEATRYRDWFESNGWRVGRNPMKDWRAAARNWVSRAGTNGAPPGTSPPRPARRVLTPAELEMVQR